MNEYAFTQRHMGTDVTVSLVCLAEAQAEAIATGVFSAVHEYELRFSRFLPESELSKLNRERSRMVSNEFAGVLTRCRELYTLTDGGFNPLVQVARLGYTKTFSSLKHTSATADATKYDTDLTALTVDTSTNRVTLAPTQALDFGGILKGYLAERLADRVGKEHPECQGVIINIGGDIASRGVDAVHEPFMFLLYDPVGDKEIPVALRDASLATSGAYQRRWQSDLGEKHHIVDSVARDNPQSGLVAVSILHQSGSLTEALTKLFLVAGVKKALEIARPDQHHYQYFAVSENGDIVSNFV